MYDLTIIGAGWAGFNAAIRAKKLGLSVCLIDSKQIGGTCLNYGCIPTKTLIASAKVFLNVKKSSNFGVISDNPRINFAAIQDKKNKVISQLRQGMQSRLSGIDFINSAAKIISPQEIKVDSAVINSKFILIATGSYPVCLPSLEFDHKKIISSDDALELSEIPSSLLIVGGGVIGCEFAGLFSALGSQVTIVEKMSQLLPAEDKDLARKIEVIFNKKGIKVVTGADVSNFNLNDYSKILVCTGRVPNLQELGLRELGLELNGNRIFADDYLKSGLGNIYVAGDCTAKLMLAHYAAYQGVIAVENMFLDKKQPASNSLVPACIFTDPQIASVGTQEAGALSAGLPIKVHKFDFRGNAMAHIIEETEGFIKIVINSQSGRIIGASIIGPCASELISTLTVAISSQLGIDEFSKIIFAHPTFSEGLHETLSRP